MQLKVETVDGTSADWRNVVLVAPKGVQQVGGAVESVRSVGSVNDHQLPPTPSTPVIDGRRGERPRWRGHSCAGRHVSTGRHTCPDAAGRMHPPCPDAAGRRIHPCPELPVLPGKAHFIAILDGTLKPPAYSLPNAPEHPSGDSRRRRRDRKRAQAHAVKKRRGAPPPPPTAPPSMLCVALHSSCRRSWYSFGVGVGIGIGVDVIRPVLFQPTDSMAAR